MKLPKAPILGANATPPAKEPHSATVFADALIRGATVAVAGAWIAIGGGLLVLLGWIAGSEALRSFGPGNVIMLPITAITFVLGGIALLLVRSTAPGATTELSKTTERGGVVLALALTLIGAVMLLQRVVDVELAINLWLFPVELTKYRYLPLGLMAINSSLSFTLLGAALLLLVGNPARPSVRRRRKHPRRSAVIEVSQLLSALSFFIALTALIGYAYGNESLYSFERASAMAFSTAACFAALSAGVFAARPDRGLASLIGGRDVAGVLARPLLAAAVVVPVVLGWVWLTATTNMLTREGGATLFVVLTILTLVIMVLRTARIVQRTDRARDRARAVAEHARVAAEAANRAKGEFLTIMSHELRTPLNAIAGHAQLIEMELHGPVTAAQREALARINRSQRHLLRLINEVLNFARVDSGRVEYHLDDVAVAEVVSDLNPMIGPQLAARSLSYSTELDPGVRVRADREKMQQILLNLLSNAVKFTPQGGRVIIDCPTPEEPADASLVFVRVRDSGIGIPRDRLDAVFEPFVQIDASLTRVQEGVGLGLAISRDLARAMGGDLRARSVVGEGSTFTLVLPVADSPAQAASN